jgi:hypothetical protein
MARTQIAVAAFLRPKRNAAQMRNGKQKIFERIKRGIFGFEEPRHRLGKGGTAWCILNNRIEPRV